MKQPTYLKKWIGTTEQAVAPRGTAACFISTELPVVPGNPIFSFCFQQRGLSAENADFDNLLLEKHYFRLSLAKAPPASVIIIKGRKNSSFVPVPEVSL